MNANRQLTPLPDSTLAAWLIVLVSLMLFIAISSAYLLRSAAADWQALAGPPIIWLNLLLLILSSGSLQFAQYNRKSIANNQTKLRGGLIITALLAICFLAGQLLACQQLWSQLAGSNRLISDPHAAFFYLFTGLHGLQLLIALLLLISLSFQLTKTDVAQRLAALTIYWHWLAILALCLNGLLFMVN